MGTIWCLFYFYYYENESQYQNYNRQKNTFRKKGIMNELLKTLKTSMEKDNDKYKKFLYFDNLKLKQYSYCLIDCPFKEEEIYYYCGKAGFCDLFHQNYNKILSDNEFIFKYR
jgi:hypothetical protein